MEKNDWENLGFSQSVKNYTALEFKNAALKIRHREKDDVSMGVHLKN